MKVLLVTAPMTQLNTPYPATPHLVAFLRSRGVAAVQADLSLGLALRLFSRQGVAEVAEVARRAPKRARTESVSAFLDQRERYEDVVEPVIAFLQGRDPTLAHRIAGGDFLPTGPRFAALDTYEAGPSGDALAWAFGSLGLVDRARHLASLFLDDVADVVRDAVDPKFGFVRYGESLAASQASFDGLATALAGETLLDRWLESLVRELLDREAPDLLAVTAPFDGNVYGAFRIAQAAKAHQAVTTVLGGGFANTSLRELAEPRVFDAFDFVVLDAGEQPFVCLLDHLNGGRPREALKRTYARVRRSVKFFDGASEGEVAQAMLPAPTYDGLPLDRYLSVLELLNPMHRLWSDGRWNKLMVAYGCYWKKCAFCDTSLDYIARYDAVGAKRLADRIDALMTETGQTGFHFVDEAAPPRALGALADELLARRRTITWWGNIRFEKAFTPELCEKLAQSGCIAVTGGLEVASDRLLALMNKGVSIEQVARVTRGFTDAGVLVHAYLMYGFPTQTVQDTVDALEIVRQLFDNGCVQSGFWHRFTATVHAPVALDPDHYGITVVRGPRVKFARNDLSFVDPTGVDHDTLGVGLNAALYNYMHGIGLDEDVRTWFSGRVPRTTIPPHRIERALE